MSPPEASFLGIDALAGIGQPIWTVGIVCNSIYACALRKWYSLHSTVFCYVCYLARQQYSSVYHVPRTSPVLSLRVNS